MLCFVFISTSALSITGQTISPIDEIIPVKASPRKDFPPIPVLGVSNNYPVLSAQGVLATDLISGIALYEKNADAPLLPASTTKIITALVALDTYPLDLVHTVPFGVNVEGQKMGLYKGEQITTENLLYGLLVYSANDAAYTLAANYPGGYSAFVDAMNDKATDLSMQNTSFDNPIGLDGNSQRSTARDLILASEVAMRNHVFAKIVGTSEIVVSDVTGKYIHKLKNLNLLLGSVPGVTGVKTGWTESARENLVTFVERDGHKIMITLLGSQDRFGETKELIDWIFANYIWEPVEIN